tara:strand:- start:1378 stop:1722 length:345 start_codon:yes stop_codon:yes gene_type:complete
MITYNRTYDLEETKEALKEAIRLYWDCAERNDHKLQYSNPYGREAKRLRKLIELIELTDTVEDYQNAGLVLIDGKFVVSLSNNKWRAIHKNKWYRHKSDIKHFVDNYINKRISQ